MTTIAYHLESNTVAYDSRSTTNTGLISNDNHEKSCVRDGVIFIFTGYTCDSDKLMDYYFGKRHEFKPEANAFVICNGAICYIGVTDEHEIFKEPVTCNVAYGSGSSFALAAMDFGKSAVEAVEYAMTRDSATGGNVKEIKVNSNE